uniref:Uncharacterized protein n=2 Tax=Phaeomonas parva TaxID=124430 RepID=A0A7S1TPY3_9STRA|mmetsp:Transcript_10536/g.31723  ORF Transcript_10536/g.31723 Transcript_10536/m.31723 type:complete len:151 (+) Transcript_10536:585-1037(+)
MLFPADGMTLARAAQKTFVNQLFMSPGLNMAFFAFVLITREGAARKAPKEPPMRLNGEGPPPPRGFWPQYKAKLRADLWPTIVRSCGFWGTVQMVNFRYVPETLTLLYTNVAFLIWTVYVSIVGHRKVDVRAGGDKQKKELSLQKVQVNS